MRRPISHTHRVTIVLAISAAAALTPLVVGAVADAAARGSTINDSSPASQAVPLVTAQGPSPITRIELRLVTSNQSDAGTDGDVFIGVGGREFFVDSAGNYDDFEKADDRTYVFGDGANVARPEQNDPRRQWPITYDDMRLAPRYVRFEPGDDWLVGRADITVSTARGDSVHFVRLEGGPSLWLGERRGKVLYFR